VVDINDIGAVVDLLIARAEPIEKVLARSGSPEGAGAAGAAVTS
jgi:hypothetical protein